MLFIFAAEATCTEAAERFFETHELRLTEACGFPRRNF